MNAVGQGMGIGVADAGRRGLSLLEVIITLGMIGALSTVFVINIDNMLRRGELDTLEDQFWLAVRGAQENAVYDRKPYILSYSEDERAFVVSSGEERTTFQVIIEGFDEDPEIEVIFSEQYAENSYKLIGGRLVTDNEVIQVGFYPDGTCSPFTAELRILDYTRIINIDPWTGVELAERREG